MELAKLKVFLTSMGDRSNLVLTLKIIVVVSATLALFSQDLNMVFSDAMQSEISSHILAVPFIFAYMLYRKRKTISAILPLENTSQQRLLKHIPSIAGTLLVTTAILLYWHGSYTFTPLEYHMFALPLFAAGLLLLLFNYQTLLQLAFPILFLFFLVPPPSEILFTVGAVLSTLSSQASSAIANLAGIPSVIINEYDNPLIQITRPGGTTLDFTVDVACSGIYSLIGFLVFATLVAYIIRDKPWKKIALILMGIPIIYLFNVLRITTILIIGYHYGENLALQVFHLLGGWVLVFIGTLLLLFISEKILKTRIFSNTPEKCPECSPPARTDKFSCFRCGRILQYKKAQLSKGGILKIVAIIAAVGFFLSIQAPVFAMTQTPANVIVNTPTGQTISTEILPDPPNYQLSFDYRDTDFEELSQIDMAIAYIYYPEKANLNPIWVSLEIASIKSSLHRWETCLINWPLSHGQKPRVTQIELTDIQMSENPPIICRFFVFQYTSTGQIQAVLYWYESATFNINSTSQQKNVKISLIGYPESIEELNATKTQLQTIAKEIINYWAPIKLWSKTAMQISTNGSSLAATTSLLLVVTAIYGIFETIRKRKANRKIYTKLSAPNQKIMDAIQTATKNAKPTLDTIAAELQKTTGKTIDKEQLLQTLTALEKQHAIESQTTNYKDEPIQTWKT